MSALHELNFLRSTRSSPRRAAALENNPEPLKLTFDETTADLLSKIMQGTDERYRLSVAFQMRPVMIVPGSRPRASLLVGVDYTTAPQTIIGEDGVQIDVIPSLGPRLDRVEPDALRGRRSASTIFGDDLHGSRHRGRARRRGADDRRAPRRSARRRPPKAAPARRSRPAARCRPASMPLVVRRRLSPTRTRSSNLLVARLLPTVTGASARRRRPARCTGLLLGDRQPTTWSSRFYPATARRCGCSTP